MANQSKVRDECLETEILSAGPFRRVQMLYEGALDALAKARIALAAKDIRARAAQVNKAYDILSELALSLDHSRGESVTKELVELYDYVQRCLIEGNAKQVDRPFADAERVLNTLLEAWKSIPEVEAPSTAAPGGHYVPGDYGSGDTFSIRGVSSVLDQVG